MSTEDKNTKKTVTATEGIEINNAVSGCVVDWKRRIQINPKTRQVFDFDGNLLEVPAPAPVPKPKPVT